MWAECGQASFIYCNFESELKNLKDETSIQIKSRKEQN